MQYRLNDRLGTSDAARCNQDYGAHLPLEADKLAKGAVVELPEKAVVWLTGPKSQKCRGLVSLLEPIERVRGTAKQSEITAPAKQ